MNFQGVVMNVGDLNRSIEFYREVFGFTLLSQEERLAVVSAPGDDRAQVIVLRALDSGPMGGARHIGLRAFLLEVDSAEEMERITAELDARKSLFGQRDHTDWSAVVGRDLDGVAVVVARAVGQTRITEASWKTLDDFLYGIGE
jgi:catechol-2,3-dioxygenase